MNNNANQGNNWGGPNGANVEEFRKQPGMDNSAAAAQKHNPFASGKSGPPVFYRSKTAGQDERDTEAPSNRPSQTAPQSKFPDISFSSRSVRKNSQN